MKKVKLADVLWRAANERLRDGYGGGDQPWSCHAIYAAMYGSQQRNCWSDTSTADDFVVSLGCDPDQSHFGGFRSEHDRQGVRYMWLLLAMHVAEDEGIEIETESA